LQDVAEALGAEARDLCVPSRRVRRAVRIEQAVLVELELLVLGDVRGKRRTPWRQSGGDLVGGFVQPHRDVVRDAVHHVWLTGH